MKWKKKMNFSSILSKYAKLVVNYCVNIKKDDTVLIWGPVESIPLINEIYREVLKSTEGHPYTQIIVPEQDYIFYKEAKEHQIEYSNPFQLYLVNHVDVAIKINAPSNTRELSNINPEVIKKVQLAKMNFWKSFFQRQATGELVWTSLQYPTDGMAQEANMSKEEFGDFINKTCFLDKEDPIAEWQSVSQQQQKYCDYLEKGDQIQVIGEGTDLTLSVKGRKWENSDGKKNMPSGEIFTGPIEDSINGIITFSFPGIYQSRIVEGIVLKFENGQVIEASADKGQDILDQILKIPGAKRAGEFAIGTNYNMTRFIKNIAFDEKIGGTIHMALGNGYPETGSKNQSAIHWDLICDMRKSGKIFADGKLMYENGKILIN